MKDNNTDPEFKEELETPEETETPEEKETPETPETPEEPEEPETPENPETPEAPEETEAQEETEGVEDIKKQLCHERVMRAATMQAVVAGVTAKNIPYVLRLADFSAAVDEKGEINTSEIDKAINQVLEDIPALNASESSKPEGFSFGSKGDTGKEKGSEAENRTRRRFGLASK